MTQNYESQSQMIDKHVPGFWIKEIELAGFMVNREQYVDFTGPLRIVDPRSGKFVVLGWEKLCGGWWVFERTDGQGETAYYEKVEEAMGRVSSWVKSHGA